MMREGLIIEILNKFKHTNTGFWIITTGWGLDYQKALNFKTLGLRGIMVSLDDFVGERINKIKGEKAFENAINAIRAANKAGLITVADCVMNRALLNESRFEQYISFTAQLGVDFINLYAPRTSDVFNEENLKPFTVNELIQLGILARKNQVSKKSLRLPIAYSPDNFEAKRTCMGGKLFFYISPKGDVKACPFQKTVIGNINSQNLKEIFLNFENNNDKEICQTNKILSNTVLNLFR